MTTQTASTVWPAGVIARYLTVTGATVDISRTKSQVLDDAEFDLQAWLSQCNGCDDSDTHDGFWGSDDNLHAARHWAQSHAETCRAMPKPSGQA
ncbi:hypothetical protein [Streptomyces sp. NBC_01789]|uniref:hypothetical protein n=1 Tax=Streptomyces sp. NBC_01789 TaxID=2975941 RepID=UPI00225BE46C|nr:hypothetical protein [Streptomyces sp. NBC_01789]MCX4450665.1 hypothetical protein [Streptomyces sp. NBC_01789]